MPPRISAQVQRLRVLKSEAEELTHSQIKELRIARFGGQRRHAASRRALARLGLLDAQTERPTRAGMIALMYSEKLQSSTARLLRLLAEIEAMRRVHGATVEAGKLASEHRRAS